MALLIFYAALAQGYERSTYVNAAQTSIPSGYEQAQGGGGSEALAAPLAPLPAVVPSLPQGDTLQGAASPPVAEAVLSPDTGTVVHTDDPGLSADVRSADNGGVQPEPELTRQVALTFYNCYGQGGGYCGGMASGAGVYEGAAACGASMVLGTRFTIEGDASGRTYTCEDRGLGPYDWVDVFFWQYAEGRAWRNNLPLDVTLHILS